MESGARAIPARLDLCRWAVCDHSKPSTQAQASKLGARNKALIPTDARIACTLRNLNFLLAYWLEFEPPSPLEDYGFRTEEGGVLVWDD